MPLNVPTLREISKRVVIRARGNAIPLSDLNPGSVLRILINAFAEGILELWYALVRMNRAYFIDTATGADLDRRLADFGLVRPQGAIATGTLTVLTTGDATITAGSIVQTVTSPLVRYAISANPDTTDGSWALGIGGGEVKIHCLEPGAAGNVGAGMITAWSTSAPTNVLAISNLTSLTNGQDGASDSDARAYLRSYLLSLTRGTVPSLRHAVLTYTDSLGAYAVHSVGLQEWDGINPLIVETGDPYFPTRQVSLIVYLDDGSGTAGGTLCATIQALLEGDPQDVGTGYVGAGVPFIVKSATRRVVDVACGVEIAPIYAAGQVLTQVQQAIFRYFSDLPVAELRQYDGYLTGQVDFGELSKAVTNVPGVERVAFSAPLGPVQVLVGEKAIAGTVEVVPL